MVRKDVCVVVPTIREYDCVRDYVRNAREHGFDTDRLEFVLVTEDFCETGEMRSMLRELGVDGRVFDGTAREMWYDENGVSEYADIVPAASHAETTFGLLYMWAEGHDYGVFIDDDTAPHDDVDYFGTHLGNLRYEGTVEEVSSDERWVNVLYQSYDGLYPRGYPYAAMDENVRTEETEVERGEVVASQGLWTNVPDLDAVRILMDGDLQGQAQTRTSAEDFKRDFVAARGNYLTVCSMNLGFRREIIPAFYQMPMDDNEWDVGRFDDIWSGVVLKRACDVLGRRVYNGAPLCEHNKAPRSTFDDLTNEVAGLELNEHFWEAVDEAGEGASTYAEVADDVADTLTSGDWDGYNNGGFLNYAGEKFGDYLDCLDALAPVEGRAVADD